MFLDECEEFFQSAQVLRVKQSRGMAEAFFFVLRVAVLSWVKVGLGQLSFFFDPDADHGASASGLSTVVASTHGFVPIAGTSLLVSLNA